MRADGPMLTAETLLWSSPCRQLSVSPLFSASRLPFPRCAGLLGLRPLLPTRSSELPSHPWSPCDIDSRISDFLQVHGA